MGIFDRKPGRDKPKPDFSNVKSGSSSTAPPPAAPAPAAPAPQIHVVAPGDSLWKIAKKVYGKGNLWPQIYDANKETIGGNPDLIKPGQKLVIPPAGAQQGGKPS
jgi:nucleoid-associated protein YgaU